MMVKKIAGKRDPVRDGTHDWELVQHFHRCESCGRIIESRDQYVDRLGDLQKDLKCDFCGHEFTVSRSVKPTFGPFFGKKKV